MPSVETYLGTWQTAPSDGFWTGQNLSDSESVISSAVRSGIRGFDTARSYGKGQAEQTLSKVLRRFPGDYLIDTKIMPGSKAPEEALRPSLDRLKPFSIDCLYLHWPRSGFDNKAYLQEMNLLKDAGTVRRIGVCNMPLENLSALVSQGVRIDRLQRPVSLLWTRELDETMAFCRENGIGLAAYSPSGMGLLSGNYPTAESLTDARSKLFCFDSRCIDAYHELLSLIAEIARNNSSDCISVALSWVKYKNPDIVILGARNADQLRHNLSAALELSDSELSDLDGAAAALDRASRDVCENIFSYNW